MKHLPGVHGKLGQRRHEAFRFRVSPAKAAATQARLADAFAHGLGDLRGADGAVLEFGVQVLREHLAQHFDAGEMLAQPVVQILADAALSRSLISRFLFPAACAR